MCVYFDIDNGRRVQQWNGVVGSCCDTTAIPCYDAKLNAPWHCVYGPLVHTQPKHEVGREVRSSKPHAIYRLMEIVSTKTDIRAHKE